MIKLFSLKQEKKDNKGGSGDEKKKVTAAQIRAQKDITELSLPSTITVDFPDADDILNFNLTINPDDGSNQLQKFLIQGYYKGGSFKFSFKIKPNYPHEPPKVLCTQKIYHPNIDLEGNVCLNILREDWKPVLNINAVIYGMQFLFLEPNADDPLNKEAATVLSSNKTQFQQNVTKSMRGDYVGDQKYDNVLIRK